MDNSEDETVVLEAGGRHRRTVRTGVGAGNDSVGRPSSLAETVSSSVINARAGVCTVVPREGSTVNGGGAGTTNTSVRDDCEMKVRINECHSDLLLLADSISSKCDHKPS